MTDHSAALTVSGSAPLTKFRAPRIRDDTVVRAPLFARLIRSVEANPVTLVCAPGGSGKSTLLAQLAADRSRDLTVLWVALDEEDNSVNRLFAALLQAVEPLGLTWESDPRAFLGALTGPGTQCRAALATLVNALCTSPARRIVLILDDLHHIVAHEIAELIEALIERLPDHVALVLGSRIEPELPLARWRAHGEIGEFGPEDLRFTETDATALALARFGDVPRERDLRDALARTHGWAVGLSLMLQSRSGASTARSSGLSGESADRHLFAYLAQEILGQLPESLRDFVVRCSILSELSPDLCAAVTGRNDAGAVLDALYRRNLFLTALDETTPVLKFHDLFREFLHDRLEREHPELLPQLHAAAASAETVPARAITHLLHAQRWDEASARILQHGEGLLLEGGLSTLERWIDQIPESARAGKPEITYLRGVCAWMRWDWSRCKRELTPAVEGLAERHQVPMRVRAYFGLVDALSSSGEPEAAWQRLEEVSRFPLDDLGLAHLALQRSWSLTHSGDHPAIEKNLHEFIDRVRRDPTTIVPSTAPRIHCLMIGLPGTADAFERFGELGEMARGAKAGPWQIAATVVNGWGHLWRGRREQAQAALERVEALQHQFGSIRAIAERVAQFKALFDASIGQTGFAIALAHVTIDGLRAPELANHCAAWLRPYRHALARMYWVADDAAGFRSVLPYLTAPRNSSEWPFLDTAADVARGQAAILARDWKSAEVALTRALGSYSRYRMPMIYCDPRLHLAFVHAAQGRKSNAWAVFEPALREFARDRAVGVFVLELPRLVDVLIDLIPAEVAREPEIAWVIEALARWRAATTNVGGTGPLAELSEREIEVLAQVAAGASNKQIARTLSLSLHTVKRHIANILDKVDCDSRGQAADLYRRHV